MRFATVATLTLMTGTLMTGALALGAVSMVRAQPAPPPGEHGPEMRRPPHGPMGPGVFGLMYRPDDRKLTPPEVQKIAEGVLLWFGNRNWKVTDVHQDTDGKIAFAFATAGGSVIARFTMDSKTGRIARTG